MLVISEEFIAMEEAIDQLVACLKKVPQYQAYAEAKAAVEADGNLQVEMSRFQDIKKRYDASKALQEFRPEVRQLRREMLLQKRTLDCHPLVVSMRLAQMDLQEILANISEEIAGAVSDSIFVDTDFLWHQNGRNTHQDHTKILKKRAYHVSKTRTYRACDLPLL